MQKILFISPILLLIFFLGVTLNFSQSKPKIEQVIRIELTFEEDSDIKREIEIPIDERGFGVGGRQFCDDCEHKFGGYEFNAGVWKLKNNKFRVRFAYIYSRKWKRCNFEKVFIVQKDTPSEMQLRCGVKLKAYYEKSKKEE